MLRRAVARIRAADDRGFTVVEVVVATAVLAMACVALAQATGTLPAQCVRRCLGAKYMAKPDTYLVIVECVGDGW